MSDSELDPSYLGYESDFSSILKGIYEYRKSIPLKDGSRFQLHYYCNLLINRNFELVELKKSLIRPFSNYEDYEYRLLQTLNRFVKNAQAPERKIKYNLIATISKGYDAAACSAIAYEIGCRKVVSFNKPKKYEDDCGDDIAKRLGYNDIITKSADEYLNNESLVEAEFVSSGELGSGIVFSVFENEFKDNVVFIGERGDKIWDKNRTDSNNEFRFENEIFTGTSMVENRLRVGYIVLPMPLFGASQWISIHTISNSSEMEPYSIGGTYDRPIPRRILETRNVDREMFGLKKKGIGFNYRYDTLSRIKSRMSQYSFNSFYKFYKNNKKDRLFTTKHWIRYFWRTKTVYYNYFMSKLSFSQKKQISLDTISNPGAPSYLFNWGVDEMVKRYKKAEIDRWWL